MAQLGRALRSGRRGRRFKSCRPDQLLRECPPVRRELVLPVSVRPPGACCAWPNKSAAITITTTSASSTCWSPCSTSPIAAIAALELKAARCRREASRRRCAVRSAPAKIGCGKGILVTPRVREIISMAEERAGERTGRTRATCCAPSRRKRQRRRGILLAARASYSAAPVSRAVRVEHLSHFFLNLVDHFGYAALFVGMVLGNCGLPVGAELVLPAAGALAATGHLSSCVARDRLSRRLANSSAARSATPSVVLAAARSSSAGASTST